METNLFKSIGVYNFALFLAFFSLQLQTKAQTSILQRPVYLELKNTTVDKALEIISKQCNFNFTYNTSLFRGDSSISVYSQGSTVKQVLDKIFKNAFDYKAKGNNLIIARPSKKDKDSKVLKKTSSNYIIQGSISNQMTGENIAYASVYDTTSLASAVTNIKGFFQLVLDSKTAPSKIAIAVSKKDFIDTVIVVEPSNENNLQVLLSPQLPFVEKVIQKDTVKDTLIIKILQPIEKEKKDITSEKWLQLLATFKQRIAAINISQNKDHYAQLSLVPSIGTDGVASALYTYHLSVNAIGGYTGAIEGLEAGSIFNINKGNVKGAQFSGLFNATGGNVEGLQASGFANRVYGKTQGVQSAGFININSDSLYGAQLAGYVNINGGGVEGFQGAGFINIQKGKLKGGQFAGFMNTSGDSLEGVQAAGFLNIAKRTVNGVQIAGFSNIQSKNNEGAQLAGFLNISKNAKTQIAGFMNLADTAKGFQAAGFLNKARAFQGVHLGVINIADSCSGVPIGVFSFIKKGLHQIELSANEVAYANVGFRTGVKKLYTTISVGAQPIQNQYKFIYGFGIGHSFEINPKSNINAELFATQVHLGNWNQFNNIYSLKLGYERFLVPKVSVFVGVSANINVYETNEQTRKPYANLAFAGPKLFSENYGNDFEMNGWVGFNTGIRFL